MTVKSEQKFVFLLTIDCLRYDHLKSYGYFRNTAKNQDEFTKNGITFMNAIANGPETASSFSSIFSSVLPYLNGGFCPLPHQKKIFTQDLHENKVICYGIHSNPYLGKFFNYHRGFDVFIDGLEQNTNQNRDLHQNIKNFEKKLPKLKIKRIFFNFFFKNVLERIIIEFSKRFRLFEFIRNKLFDIDFIKDKLTVGTRKFRNIGFTASDITKTICNYISNYKSQRSLFLWAHFMDVHWPYNPPPKDLLKVRSKNISASERDFLLNKIFWNNNLPQTFKKSRPDLKLTKEHLKKIIDLYDGAICYVDRNLKNFFNIINKKLKKNCLFILTADHGEAFYEHEYLNHSGQVFDELLRVPLFLIELGKTPKFKRIDESVQLLDIAPTILDYYGIEIPKHYQGKSLLPYMRGGKLPKEDFVISESYQENGKFNRNSETNYKIFSIRKKIWKYIFDEQLKREYIFDIKKDPKEKNNLIENSTDFLKEFINIRQNHFQKIEDSEEKAKIAYSIKNLKL